MKYLKILFLTLCISCSGDQRSEVVSSVPYDTLQIVDSIGVLYGDSNYVFGSITDVDRGLQGEIYVLDSKRNCILVFSQDGDFIYQIGRYGEGPGEFNAPSSLEITGDGSICVVNANQWSRFNSEREYVDAELLDNSSIMQMESYGSDEIVGIVNELALINAGMSVGRRIAMWNEFDPNQYLNVYYQADYIANVPDDIFEIDLYHYVKLIIIEDIIYVAPEPLIEPLIICYNGDGTPRDTLLLPYSAVEKTAEDIAEEKSFIEGTLYSATSGERSIEWEPYPYRAMIGELGTDSLGRLWVQRAFDDVAAFDIIDPDSLEIVGTVVIPEIDDVMNWEFYISEDGFLGVQKYEYEYPIVYIIQ
jgi:hypothetical protein